MATPPEEQLSLVAALGLEADPSQSGTARTASPDGPTGESDDDLMAEAAARPRRRQGKGTEVPAGSPEPAGPPDPAEPGDPADTLPPWHHHGLVDPEALPPVLRHYVELKAAHPERVLLYRLGDFYECFFEDAIRVARLLELTLTGKEGGKRIGRVPMAGIPHHAAERYCGELVRRGLAVALCDQLESTPAPGALLRRGITRVLTPGTVLEEGMLAARRNNWLAAVVLEQGQWGLAVADVSTGEFQLMQRQGSDQLHQDLLRLEPAELLWPTAESGEPAWAPESIHRTPLPLTPFTMPEARRTLMERFELASLEGLGLGEAPLALRAAGGLVRYLDDTQPVTDETAAAIADRIPLDRPTLQQRGDQLVLDAQTRRNLEITQTQRDGQFQGSLLWALDRTMTAMGARALRRWLDAPLMELEAIERRQDGIGVLVQQRPLRLALRRLLRPMGDLERLAGRAGAGSASARDLVALADGLERLPRLAALLEPATAAVFGPLQTTDPELAELAALVRHTLVDAPSLSLSEGGLIHDGVDGRLDGLRNRLDDQDQWLAAQEQEERRRSGIPTLRLQFHRSFGYFLSVSRARAGRVPEHWIRRQTLANEERFVTPELKAREGRILQLRARAAQREYELFSQLRQQVGELAGPIRQAARRVAGLDALASLADVAACHAYCRPQLEHSRCLQVEAGRHPVVEQLLVEESFSANDLHLGEEGRPDLVVLTGPNASGKSCYLRQNGLLQLMAQIGSWIPARSARLGLADRIFTRVGAVDDLASGQSTFMVEMAETANILHHATDRSLVLLDEIGRGTATFDGLSIAWAVAEHLAAGLRARAVFATHYHELNELASLLPGVANYQVMVEETGDRLLFLHQVRPGGASRSYGIEAARLAGVPPQVVQRARQVLGRIEANSHVAVGLQAAA
ncbi:DNA mismatch repair protein MutS [Synechococcus sp. CBW1107]|uniref:DNA mismatch repair protein MutS n=1 Tax=Synechococcus sp. CBW1107 TaxID=2789857 RepID=UPI002AD4299D|nr:DNA mismatch repair protein MutS [Synechococcus sp. CBW1107]CAK6688218.1 DNA mismatch repair protein MutS [Synechococcus sp. CBW1107]